MGDLEETPETYWSHSYAETVGYGSMEIHKAKMLREIAVQLKRIADMFERLEND